MNNLKLLLIIALIISVFMSCTSTKNSVTNATPKAPLQDRLLWKIVKPGQNDTSLLYGTFHLMCKEDVNFNEQITKGIEGADKVYFEIDLDDPGMMLSMMQMLQMKDGKSLSDFVSAEEYQRLDTYFKDSVKASLNLFKGMKPFFAQSMLYPKFMMNCRHASGVEQELMALAVKNKKEILGLETLQLQASIFDTIPYELQAKGLVKMIDSMPKFREDFQKMYNYYRTENLTELGKLMEKSDDDMAKYMPILLTNRNHNWVKTLRDILPGQSLFIAVGAGHLVGNDGLIRLLRQEGYVVEPAN